MFIAREEQIGQLKALGDARVTSPKSDGTRTAFFRKLAVALSAVLSFVMATAYGEDAIFKGGRWKEIVYDKPSKTPVFFSGMSRSENACAPDYCIYLDMWYDDGTPVWGVRADWTQGTHGWERTAGAFVPAKPIKKIQMFVFLRRGTGKAEFKDLVLERR